MVVWNEIEFIEDVVVANGWPRDLAKLEIGKVERKVFREDYRRMRDPIGYENERREKKAKQNSLVRMSIPFPGGNLAHKLRRISRKFDIEVVFRSSSKIKDRLVKLKESMRNDEKAGVVYRIPLNCDREYVGETEKIWKTRKEQHKGYIKDGKIKDSAILEHLIDCSSICGIDNPGVNWDKCSILGQDSNSDRRKALESIAIRKNTEKVVNRNLGSLDDVWNRALKACSVRKKKR